MPYDAVAQTREAGRLPVAFDGSIVLLIMVAEAVGLAMALGQCGVFVYATRLLARQAWGSSRVALLGVFAIAMSGSQQMVLGNGKVTPVGLNPAVMMILQSITLLVCLGMALGPPLAVPASVRHRARSARSDSQDTDAPVSRLNLEIADPVLGPASGTHPATSARPAHDPHSELVQVASQFVLLAVRYPGGAASYHRAISLLHEMCGLIATCEDAGVPKANVLGAISAAREICARSPFVRRLQCWPRGYPGDFETVEYLMSQVSRAPAGTIEEAIEWYSLGSMIAQQHRNKVTRQAQLILETVLNFGRNGCTPRVLSLACGGSPDLGSVVRYLRDLPFTLVLNDIDAAAIQFSARRLSDIADRCLFVTGNALSHLRRFGASGRYDLILAGGLFDYLSDRQVTFVIKECAARLLKEEGRLFFTNIAKGNPYRHLIEYFGDWSLIERSESDINQAAIRAGVEQGRLSLSRDATGLAIMTEITNDCQPGAGR